MGWGQKLMAAAGSLIGAVGGPVGMGVGGMLGGLAGDALFEDDEENAATGYAKQRAKQAFTPVQAPQIPSVGTQQAPMMQAPEMDEVTMDMTKQRAADAYMKKMKMMGGPR